MSWITVRGGYHLQCDRCGYHRGSLFKADGVRGSKPMPFLEQRLPRMWKPWPAGGEDAHLCPECATEKAWEANDVDL